ncbi:MAG: nucleotide sugar dehydrogenase [Alphaproteobacteria bacterium]
MKVSVFGIGYVGAVTSACLVDSGHEVIAMDKDPVKVRCICEGRTPIIEPGLDDLIKKGAQSGKLTGTQSCAEAVEKSDISLICVGTPSNPDGSLQLDYVRDVCREIGEALAAKDSFHTVVLRSTMVPGSACGVALPILEEASGKKGGVDFGFANNPEFLRESTAIFDYYNPPKIVIGASDKKTGKIVSDLYHNIDAPEVITSVEVAEGVKYADNAWHAMKVGFANELGNILKDHNVDSHKVMDIFFLDTKLNISKAYLKPGFAFGGSCLPKDVRALRASAKTKGLNTPIFDALLEANIEQVRRAYGIIEKSGAKKVGLFGLSFKADTDDLRESPLVTLADMLLKDGYELKIYDPCVSQARKMDGANKHYIEEGIPHISACLAESAQEVTDHGEIFVIGNSTQEFYTVLAGVNDNARILDLVRLDDSLQSKSGYTGICW